MPSLRISLPELIARFNGEDSCRAYLERLRWPDGPVCAKCGSKETARVQGRESVLRCKKCQNQFTVTAGTVFNDSHLPLTKWFLATYMICESKKGVSALQIQRILGIGGYKTAWHLCHRIRAAMRVVDKTMLDGKVEMDETYVGGKSHRIGRPKDKEIVIGIRKRGGELRFFHSKDVKAETFAQYIRENVSKDVDVIFTDDYPSYPSAMNRAGMVRGKHKTINHSGRVYVMGDIHTNTIESAFSLLKRGIVGTWHGISAKHLSAYLDEMCFRFNRRRNDNPFQDTLRHMVTAPVLTFKALTKSATSEAA